MRSGQARATRVSKIPEVSKCTTPAVSLGSVDTLVQIPAALTHRLVDPAALTEGGIPEDLVRISIGLEATEDLWIDLEQALRESQRLNAGTLSGALPI